jgi:hypothetical protein
MEAVVGLVREDALRWLDPAGRQPTCARQEHPQIGVADHRHQERIDLVERRDAEHLDTIHRFDALGQCHACMAPRGGWSPMVLRKGAISE